MKYLELTRLDGSKILISKTAISAVFKSDTGNVIVLYSGGNRQEIKEAYEEVKEQLNINHQVNQESA